MGTSNPFQGGKNTNPLVPDWVGVGPGPDGPPPEAPPPDGPAAGPGEVGNPDAAGGNDAPAPNRFQSGRTNFFKYAKGSGDGSGSGADRNLRRAVRSFVNKSSGGARRAAERMASERSASENLGRILSTAGTSGIRETVRRLGLADLAALPVQDIYAALVDYICPPGGELDQSFARDAYLKALTEISMARADLERPSRETSASFLASLIAHAIQNRLLNTIGNRVVELPRDVASIQNIEQQINDYIRGNVNDAMAEAGEDFPIEQIVATIDDILERSLDLLRWPDDDGRDDPDAENRQEIE